MSRAEPTQAEHKPPSNTTSTAPLAIPAQSFHTAVSPSRLHLQLPLTSGATSPSACPESPAPRERAGSPGQRGHPGSSSSWRRPLWDGGGFGAGVCPARGARTPQQPVLARALSAGAGAGERLRQRPPPLLTELFSSWLTTPSRETPTWGSSHRHRGLSPPHRSSGNGAAARGGRCLLEDRGTDRRGRFLEGAQRL